MAQRSKAYSNNAPGVFFVDQSCIDCGTCYTMAPEIFKDAGDHSEVHHQPDEGQRLRAAMALLACPTASIGSDDKISVREAIQAFPDVIEDEVHFCGFTSEASFGAWSYFIRREAGNVLMDSPRAAQPLLKRIEDEAQQKDIRHFYLLTTTAEHFFTKRWFKKIARDKVPPAIASTQEFARLCPASAICMSRTVKP